MGSLDSEKRLDIQSFTNFTAVHFVIKCHTVNSSQNFHLCCLHLGQYSCSLYQSFMTVGEDWNKNRFKNSFAVFENLRFVTTER